MMARTGLMTLAAICAVTLFVGCGKKSPQIASVDPPPVVPEAPPPPPPAPAVETAILITELPEGPAQRAGLLTGDIILRVNGGRVRSIDGLRAAVGAGGETVTVTYFRPSVNQVLALDIAVDDGRIGVGIQETPIQLTGP